MNQPRSVICQRTESRYLSRSFIFRGKKLVPKENQAQAYTSGPSLRQREQGLKRDTEKKYDIFFFFIIFISQGWQMLRIKDLLYNNDIIVKVLQTRKPFTHLPNISRVTTLFIKNNNKKVLSRREIRKGLKDLYSHS